MCGSLFWKQNIPCKRLKPQRSGRSVGTVQYITQRGAARFMPRKVVKSRGLLWAGHVSRMRGRCIQNTEEEISRRTSFRETEKETQLRWDKCKGWRVLGMEGGRNCLRICTMAVFKSRGDILSSSANTVLVSKSDSQEVLEYFIFPISVACREGP
jgi:hypothetical protein